MHDRVFRLGLNLGTKNNSTYHKVASSKASSRLSWLAAHFWIFRLFMKEKFDAYVPRPLAQGV
jgi:hypothetical protein